MEVFDRLMPGPNQLSKLREDVTITRAEMLKVHDGERTEHGLRENIRVGVQYIEPGCAAARVRSYNLMEDAATAESHPDLAVGAAGRRALRRPHGHA